ncbi:biotin/lipoyl-containing protein [Maridesulfovibrio ferrireducens]|uniref:biotin/lipoyl-containing protein n=1 Tax=Maridesulfovibrio ferrireducens TaxID=246191 RepID=UPI001A208D08|nr:biotin/lipoyl-containing protein [Maridesulfovibrio ferrireducens]MBI9109819.1 biotin attachment protein [Maridesulfovibrio ferrireducens]
MAKKKIRFMCTAFRDGFQSVYGARVKTDDFLPAVEAARDAGINWFEAGGGARFQALYFYSNEDAFDMMDRFRATAGPDADLQTLARGVNVVGLESQSSDVIKAHADLFAKHGITTIRNFDALNDVNNLIYSGQCIANAGLKHQVVVTMMELPPGCSGAHDAAFYESTLRQILDADIPFDSVCFKDASGTSTPAKVFETIKRARKMLPADVMLNFHTHETAGIGGLCYKSAIEAGADAIDLSMAPASGGTCQTDIVTMWHILRGTDYTLDIDIDKIIVAEDVFRDCMKDYFLPPEATQVDPMIPFSPMPGGALTANTQMLRDNGLMDRYPEIIRAMSEVVRKGGFGTSVTPVSQFYFQQAFNNVMFGPWEKFADGYGKMVLGYFGKTPVAPDAEIVKRASEQMGLEPTTKSPIELNDADPEKGLAPARKRLEEEGLPVTDENVFIVATCKDKGITYLKGDARVGVRYKKDVEAEQVAKLTGKTASASGSGSGTVDVSVNGLSYTVTVDGDTATLNGKSFRIGSGDGTSAAAASGAPVGGVTEPIAAPMPGLIVRLAVNPGTVVQEGQTLLIMEAMKMEMEVKAHRPGTLVSFAVTAGDQVQQGQPLAQMTI